MRSILTVLIAAVLAACSEGAGDASARGSIGVADAMGSGDSDTGGYARAVEPPELRFPRDHAAHPEFRTEWWYVTANVDTPSGRRFGVLLVFFRQALAPMVAPRESTFATRDMMLAHAAVADIDGKRFHHAERLARAAGGLGGVNGGEGGLVSIVCADWSARVDPEGDGLLPLELSASDREFAFELRVETGKPLVLQGDRGLSQKSAERGNASIYYSCTRVPIAGRIEVEGIRHDVEGLGWIDREWSTSALGAEQVGWDWFSLQLDDDTEVMWYSLRRQDGSVDPWSRGCFVRADGSAVRLDPAAVRATPNGQWRAPDGGATYPAGWRLTCAQPEFDLEVTPLLADQELHALVRYWEGAVAVRGTSRGRAVQGRGYLEMTGYATTER